MVTSTAEPSTAEDYFGKVMSPSQIIVSDVKKCPKKAMPFIKRCVDKVIQKDWLREVGEDKYIDENP